MILPSFCLEDMDTLLADAGEAYVQARTCLFRNDFTAEVAREAVLPSGPTLTHLNRI